MIRQNEGRDIENFIETRGVVYADPVIFSNTISRRF